MSRRLVRATTDRNLFLFTPSVASLSTCLNLPLRPRPPNADATILDASRLAAFRVGTRGLLQTGLNFPQRPRLRSARGMLARRCRGKIRASLSTCLNLPLRPCSPNADATDFGARSIPSGRFVGLACHRLRSATGTLARRCRAADTGCQQSALTMRNAPL